MDEIKIFFPSLFLPLPQGSRDPEKILLFSPGDRVQGRVLQQIDAHHFSLQLGGRTVVVQSNVSLPLSVDLIFRVEEAGPRTLLKWLPPESLEEAPMLSFLKRALATDVPLDQLTAKMSNLEKLEWTAPTEKESWKQFLHLFYRFSLSDLGEVVKGLNATGATPRDLISILQAIKAAGALQADLEIY